MKSALRTLVATFGGFTGLMGMEHGIGEILQGNRAPDGVVILSWPDSEFFRILGGEPAMTLIPNLLVSGILAMLVSLAFAVWAVFFVERKHSGAVLMGLSIPMLLVGGGFFPPILGMLIGAAATRMDGPLAWRQKKLSGGWLRFLQALWPWAYAACLLAWLGMFPGVPVLSALFGVENDGLIFGLLGGMFGFLLLAVVSGFARDISRGTGASSAA